MRIAIVGSGLMGGKLGTLWVRCGHEVTFSYARSSGKLARLARAAGRRAHAGSVREAVRAAEVVLLAIHWSRLTDVLAQCGPLAGKVVLSCSLPMNKADTALVSKRGSSGAEALAQRLPRARVVSAFNTVPSEVLFDVFARRAAVRRPQLLYCGDHAPSKRRTARLIRELGFEPLDVGPLRMARYTEPFALLVARLAYEVGRSPRLAYRFERLG